MKERYVDELISWLVEQPFTKNGRREFLSFSREDSYVELSILEANELDHLWSNTDRDFHLKQQQFDRVRIQMEDVLTCNDRFVLVRGIAGIGKSTFVDRFVLKWAKSKILCDPSSSSHAEVKFLFKLTCRDLNATFNPFYTMEDLLKLKFPNVFQNGFSLADLEELSHQVLVLVDGIDELKELAMFTEKSTDITPRGAVIQDILWSRSSQLASHRTIVCGRPDACQDIYSHYSPHLPIKVIEICGFSDDSVYQFVKNFHQDDVEVIIQKIKNSENLNIMASIPVYLWVICHILTDNTTTNTVNTTTELCAYSMLLFVRNHVKSIRHLDRMPLIELCKDEEILAMVETLAQLSYVTWKNNKVVFHDNDIQGILKDRTIKLEETGFITKHLYGEAKGFMYQFKHLVLQEFFCALWCFLKYDYTDDRILPIISGLFSIFNQQQQQRSSILGTFVVNLRDHVESKKNMNVLKSLFQTRDFEKVLSDKIDTNIFHAGQIVITPEQSAVLSAVYEYQHKSIVQRFLTDTKHRDIVIRDLLFQHDIRNTVYFMQILHVRSIRQLSIGNLFNQKLSNNLSSLCQLFFATQDNLKVQKIVEINGGEEMKIFTEEITNAVTSSSTTNKPLISNQVPTTSIIKQINIDFNVKEDIKTHLQFLTKLLEYVDKVILNFSIGQLFNDIKLLLENLQRTHKNIVVEICQEPKYHESLSVINTHPIKKTDFNILCDENSFTYQNLSQTLNLKNCRVTDHNISAISRFFLHRHVTMGKLGHLSIETTKRFSSALINLRSIVLRDCGLTGEQIVIMSNHLTLVEHVVLDNNYIDNSSLLSIYDGLKRNSQLKRLYLKRCGLTTESLPILLKIFQHTKMLNLSENRLSSIPKSSIEDIVNDEHFKQHGKDKAIVLTCCDLKDEDVHLLAPLFMNVGTVILSGNTRLTHLSTSCFHDYFENAGRSANLEYLDLSYCSFSEKAYNSLFSCIVYLDRFDFRSSITPEQMTETSKQILQRKSPFESLDLSSILITDEHLLNLSPCINNIKHLYVGGAFISSINALKVLCASKDSCLKILDLTGSTVDEKLLIQVLPKLLKNIKQIYLGRMNFTLSFTKKLAAELYPTKRKFLELLGMKKCEMTDSIFLPLIRCLPYIKECKFEKNRTSHKVFKQTVHHIGNSLSNNNDPLLTFTMLKMNDLIVKLRGEQLTYRYL